MQVQQKLAERSQLLTQQAEGDVAAEASTYDRIGQLLGVAIATKEAAGQDVKNARPVLHRLLDPDPTGEDARQPDGPLHTQQIGQLRPAQVGLDRQHPLPSRSKRDGEVRQRGRLALARQRAGDRDDLVRGVDVEELQVRA